MNDRIRTGAIPGFTSNTASINGVQLHYLLGGNPKGPPVLLWHGFLSTSYAWRKVMPALANAGLAVLVPDMRGYGDSDKPAGTEGYDARASSVAEWSVLLIGIPIASSRRAFTQFAVCVIAVINLGAPVDPYKTVATLEGQDLLLTLAKVV
jgi:pimeloyl-ACP methyl ester carboxylesterase